MCCKVNLYFRCANVRIGKNVLIMLGWKFIFKVHVNKYVHDETKNVTFLGVSLSPNSCII